MQERRRLTPTSYVVLGLLEHREEATPYELKQIVAASIGNFWSIPHSQLYTEPERLADSGHLTRDQETDGLRRKRYALTHRGREALAAWRHATSGALPELRDEALLKLFFEADPESLAAAQVTAHAAKLAVYEQQAEHDTGDGPRGPWRALAAGIAHEREWVRYWAELATE